MKRDRKNKKQAKQNAKKRLIKALIWIGASAAVQFAFLFYLETNYFSSKNNPEVVINPKGSNANAKLLRIPTSAQNIGLSSNGEYVSFYEGSELKVINIKDNSIKKMKFEDNSSISFYKWASNKERIIMGGKHRDNVKQTMDFLYLDINGSNKNNSTYVKLGSLTLPDNMSEVKDLESSWISDSAYAKIVHSGNRTSVYKVSSKEFMNKLTLKSYNVGNIEIMKKSDKLVYEDLNYNKIYITDGKNNEEITGISKPRLLYVDKEDNIYIAENNNENISTIYIGKQGQKVSDWRKLQLKSPEQSDNIKISSSGKVYINNNLKGTLTEVETGKETLYEGTFVALYNDGVASIFQQGLVRTNFIK